MKIDASITQSKAVFCSTKLVAGCTDRADASRLKPALLGRTTLMTILLPNIAISGYRSFGAKPAYFDTFSNINIFIGKNNAGKSNVLRLLKEVLPFASERTAINFESNAQQLPGKPPIRMALGEAVESNSYGPCLPAEGMRAKLIPEANRGHVSKVVALALQHKIDIDGTALAWSFTTFPDRNLMDDTWLAAVKKLSNDNLAFLWSSLTRQTGGDRNQHWEPQTVAYLRLKISSMEVALIPAIRRIGEHGTQSEGFDGDGIIDRLARLERPDADSQSEKLRFEAINDFLRDVTDRPSARIEIPYARDTILIHMDDKVLPIECLGSGLHEVIILAAAATTLDKQIVCIEEPELHLNPILQKKLMRYLSTKTSNQYFITTHSAALMDTPGAEVYHITLQDGASCAERVTTDSSKRAVCEDLGYHPSDLLQANCIIWVEGPSDRLYVNWWLKSLGIEFQEGIHYCVMFYGGKLAAHVSNEETPNQLEDFIMLRQLNRRGVILIDSDKSSTHSYINETKKRLKTEFEKGPGYAWITKGREVENYLPAQQVLTAIKAVLPSATHKGGIGQFDNILKITRKNEKDAQASKVEVARHIIANNAADLGAFDLNAQVEKLCRFIRDSNPLPT